MRKQIDLTAMRKAIGTLHSVLKQPYDEYIRDATIQRFEYTYEIYWKSLKRFLRAEYEIDDAITIKELYREAGRFGLLDVESWFKYHEARNLTSHTYDENTANEVYQVAKNFIGDAEKLLAKLEKMINESN